jgi:hypothetical protein
VVEVACWVIMMMNMSVRVVRLNERKLNMRIQDHSLQPVDLLLQIKIAQVHLM